MAILLLIVGLLLFIGLVVVHELGHFWTARRAGVEVEEFGIGFPPRVYKHKTKGGWLFTINLLPLGGFVKMKGEHDSDTTKGAFGAASLRDKSIIMAAGVVVNLVTAFLLLMILAWIGIPKLVDNQFTVKSDTKVVSNDIIIGGVEKGSPAEKGGVQAGDRITAIQNTQLASSKDLTAATKKNAGQKVSIQLKRSGKPVAVSATLLSAKAVEASHGDKGYLGVYPTDYTLQRSTWSAPVVAGGLIKQFTVLTFQGLGKAVKGLGGLIAGAATGNSTARSNGQKEASSQVSGPVGIFVILKEGTSLGWRFVLMIIAVISLTLAIMNILPIPALDGGRLWLTLISRGIFKKPLSQEKEELINASGFLVLLLLIVLITIVDVKRFF